MAANTGKIRVLFLCTHNQARSQMAEGLLRHLGGERYEVFSAGSLPAEQIHPLAVKAMAEIDVDISQQQTKHLDQFQDQFFDYIITTCDRIRATCPTFPNDPERIHWNLPDPAEVEGGEEERLESFQQVADLLRNRIRIFVQLPAPERLRS
ncbi:MAG: arsenate reductase ArsC [Chloroflexota bacterium]|nr:arsenate reductase ArsC [Chloroflexota bacterium]